MEPSTCSTQQAHTLCQTGGLVYLLHTTHMENAHLEACRWSMQVLYTTHGAKADPLSKWRPLLGIYSCYLQLICSECTDSGSLEASVHSLHSSRWRMHTWRPASALYSCYMHLIVPGHTSYHDGSLSLLYAADIYNSWCQDRLSLFIRMEASPW